jgi:hypothetical protein
LKSSYANNFMIARAWMSYGAYDPNGAKNLASAQAAGIPYTDVYMFPCRGMSASTQVNDLVADLAAAAAGQEQADVIPPEGTIVARGMEAGKNHPIMNGTQAKKSLLVDRFTRLTSHVESQNKWRPVAPGGAKYGMIWLDIEENPSSGCSWASYSGSDNCNYIQQLANAVKAAGQVPGIYSSPYEWQTVVGSQGGCTQVNNVPLWYAHYDNNPSFSDWPSVKFGGWSQPSMKQYAGTSTECSSSVDKDWY